MSNIIIFDLDGTLCDVEHRRHHVTKHPKNWNAFFAGIPNDPPNSKVVLLHDILYNEVNYADIIYCTGRAEEYRDVTVKWMKSNLDSGYGNYQYFNSKLLMRPDNDSRPDQIVKEEMWRKLEAEGHRILFMVDDRNSVVNHARSLGYTVFQCAPGDFNPVGHYEPKDGECLLTLMVGPSGAGKSTYLAGSCWDLIGEIVSTDETRFKMCGDLRDQSKNEQVFAYVRDKIMLNMQYGIPTVVDATHLRRKDRLAHVSLAPAGTTVRYIVVDRPLKDKLRDGGWRLDVKIPHDGNEITLVEKHDMTFKSNERDIMKGDSLPNVEVVDMRIKGN